VTEARALLVEGVRKIGQAAAERGLRLVVGVLNRYQYGRRPRPAWAIRAAGEKLWLYHAADSNRRGIGQGHSRFDDQLAALDDIHYGGPVVLACNPFTPLQDEHSLAWLENDLRESHHWLRRMKR
jgi:sugar phosphate isomerase/epimerase